METKKIAVACFIGGVICTTVALMCTPMFWWLGILAGLASGYLSYEFREVISAIPIAWQKSCRSVSDWWTSSDKEVRDWSAEPHPIFFYFVKIVIATTSVIAIWLTLEEPMRWQFRLIDVLLSFLVSLTLILQSLIPSLFVLGLVILFAFIGARVGEKCFWYPFITTEISISAEDRKERLEEKGYHAETLTDDNFFRWIAKGFGLIIYFTILFFVWILWKYSAIAIWSTLCFLWRFLCNLFKLVHSKKRILCAIDGTIGGTLAFFCSASASLTLPQQILVVLFGGLLGATIGVLNYEIISKRLLHLAPVIDNT